MKKIFALILTLAAFACATSHSYFQVGEQASPFGAGANNKTRVVHSYNAASLATAKVVIYLDTAYGVSDTIKAHNPGSNALSTFAFTKFRDPTSTLVANPDSIVCYWTMKSKWAKIDSGVLGFKYQALSDSTYTPFGATTTVALASGAVTTTRVATPFQYGGSYLPYVTGVTTIADSILVLRLRCSDR